ncbi:MAG: YtxH domain-containing protein [Chloroflexota bacterium]
MSDNNDFGTFFAGLIVGGLVGAAVALLMAPQSGEETRTVIRDKSIELKDRAGEYGADARTRAEQAYEDARVRADTAMEDLRLRADDLARSAREKASQLQEKLPLNKPGAAPAAEAEIGE